MIDYSNTINSLKEKGSIAQNEFAVASMETPSTFIAVMFGAIGSALSSSKKGHFILSANETSIKLFDINKKTGEYLGTFSEFGKSEISELKVYPGQIFIKYGDGKIKLSTAKKFNGFKQEEQLAGLQSFLRENYLLKQ